jgi:Flp pilus assembly protein TadD
MNDMKLVTNTLDLLIKNAISKLKNYEMEKAYQYIMEACTTDPNAAQPHNLLGIWYEFKSYTDLARKQYRVAYVLNPTYKPASENLERVSTLFLYKSIPVNYGEETDEDINMPESSLK